MFWQDVQLYGIVSNLGNATQSVAGWNYGQISSLRWCWSASQNIWNPNYCNKLQMPFQCFVDNKCNQFSASMASGNCPQHGFGNCWSILQWICTFWSRCHFHFSLQIHLILFIWASSFHDLLCAVLRIVITAIVSSSALCCASISA